MSALLKRDPWPADVPAIMAALRTVKGDCPATLNALLRYHLPKRIVDPAFIPHGGTGVRFTIPKSYSDRDYVRLAIEGIRKTWGEEKVTVEDGFFEGIDVHGTRESSEPTVGQGTIAELLLKVKDFEPVLSFCDTGRSVFYYFEPQDSDEAPRLCFCKAATAKKRWLEWWDQSGQDWFCANH